MAGNEPRELHDPLQRALDRAVHELPLRRAPPTLESRVLRELNRRAALPWWRRSFGHWPPAARAAFLGFCTVLIRLAFIGGGIAIAGLGSLTWARRSAALMVSAADLATSLAHLVPPAWLYDGIAIGACLYAVLFGLSAALYRMLYVQSTADESTP